MRLVGRRLGHDEGIVDFCTDGGSGCALGTEMAKVAGIVVFGALTVPRPDAHDAATSSNVNTATARRRLSTGEVWRHRGDACSHRGRGRVRDDDRNGFG